MTEYKSVIKYAVFSKLNGMQVSPRTYWTEGDAQEWIRVGFKGPNTNDIAIAQVIVPWNGIPGSDYDVPQPDPMPWMPKPNYAPIVCGMDPGELKGSETVKLTLDLHERRIVNIEPQ